MRNRRALLFVFFCGAVLASFLGVRTVCRAQEVDFAREVRPLFAQRCISCHGPDVRESGLGFDSREAALAETDSAMHAIVPGKPGESVLLDRVSSTDEWERMPPEGEPLTETEIALLRRWIEQGAPWSEHWAFVPPERQQPPSVQAEDWIRNPIDRFILAKLEANALQPAPPADRRTLARRVYFDVVGLPPTPKQLEEFLNDSRPDAYERLVDRLLDSPHYGEKWARHWLDLVRYAESNSFERDASKPFVWKYRDYVIRSFNEDKPYDQFIREQLAGDELDKVTPETITATGYYRLGTWDDEPADPLQAKYDDLDNIVSTTGQALLGLTLGCARCHDHKIDPVPQTDYYGFLAFFADVTPYALPHRRNPKYHSLWDLSPPEEKARRAELEAEMEESEEEQTAIEDAAIAKMESTLRSRIDMGERREVLREHLQSYTSAEDFARYQSLRKEQREVRRKLRRLPEPELVLALAKCDPQPEQMHVMMRGSAHAPGDPVEPCFPEIFGEPLPQLPEAPADAHSAGRRRVLADWIASPENMLTGRVMVNRVWQHHFGRGIVRSPNNFGLLGSAPTHPELLDWLANWFVDHGWQLKSLHRLILTSSAYRMSSEANAKALASDPTNDLFWRFDMRRLTAEEIRDTALQVSGQLNEKMFGPSIYPKLSEEVLGTQSRPGDNWHTSNPEEAARRSIYIHIKRSLIPPELANFDFPETDTSCEVRFNTTQPAQALNLLHGQFMQTAAKKLAARVQAEEQGELSEQVGHAMRLALQREPDEESVRDGLELINRYVNQHDLDRQTAFEQYCLMVLNLNEFVYLD